MPKHVRVAQEPSGIIPNVAGQRPIQTSLFEEDFLVRMLRTLAYVPEAALTELVANAWDAGASRVSITIPEKSDQELIVEDDGVGMTPDDFLTRWMTLGYNREKHRARPQSSHQNGKVLGGALMAETASDDTACFALLTGTKSKHGPLARGVGSLCRLLLVWNHSVW